MNTLTKLYQALTLNLHDEEGASMVEYGLLVAFIALAALVAVIAVGDQLLAFFNKIAGDLGAAAA